MNTSGRRIFIVAGVVSLFISYLGIWIRLINDPKERTGSDFIAFYSAGRVAQNEGMARVYDPALQQKIQEEQVGFPLATGQVLLYNHLPFLIPILKSLVTLNYVDSFYRWTFILITIYVASILFLSLTLHKTGINKKQIVLTATGCLLFLPLFFSLMNGQDTAFLLLGATIWMYGLISGKELLAGVGLSLATVRPHIALLLAIPMFYRHRRTFLGFVISSGILALISVALLGLDGIREFINIILLSGGGEWYGMKENAMYNLIGLLTRTAPWLGAGTIRTIGWIVYGMAFVLLCSLWNRKSETVENLIGLSIIITLFTVPHLHLHDLALLIIPIYGLVMRSGQSGLIRTEIATVLPIAISILFLLSNASYFLQYTVPYLIMLALAGYPYYLKHNFLFTSLRRS